MKKTFSCYLVLLGLMLLQRADAQGGQPAQNPRSTAAEPARPVDDPLGRGTPQGAVKGLVEAVKEENLERAAEYLDSRLKPRDRQALAQKLGVVLDRKASDERGATQ